MTNIYGAKCIGIEAVPVTVEIDITSGIGIHLVGLADVAVKESLLRTITAMQSMGFRIPGKKIVINLAPADLHKIGSGYDVPIAVGIISASRQRELPLINKFMVMGELGLDGSVRTISGGIPIVELAEKQGFEGCILPKESALEAVDFKKIKVFGVDSLEDVLNILSGTSHCTNLTAEYIKQNSGYLCNCDHSKDRQDFADIIGQEAAKRGIEIAAAGGHNLLLIGPPGSGKSSLAKAMAAILPPMSLEESIQTSKIYSVSGIGSFSSGLMKERPFRAPHYSSSLASLIGGGSRIIMPGEISLAHNGILFLDEFCESPKRMIEVLRGPMEDRKITISRLHSKVEFPADFMLIAATNPCPCGYYGEKDRCICSPTQRLAYLSKLSGPIMDRIDIQLWIHPVNPKLLVNKQKAESSAVVAQRVLKARKIQNKRFAGTDIFCNAAMDNKLTEKYCKLNKDCSRLMERLIEKMGLSARTCFKILKLARTIADLEGVETINQGHIAEAAGYRLLDKLQ